MVVKKDVLVIMSFKAQRHQKFLEEKIRMWCKDIPKNIFAFIKIKKGFKVLNF